MTRVSAVQLFCSVQQRIFEAVGSGLLAAIDGTSARAIQYGAYRAETWTVDDSVERMLPKPSLITASGRALRADDRRVPLVILDSAGRCWLALEPGQHRARMEPVLDHSGDPVRARGNRYVRLRPEFTAVPRSVAETERVAQAIQWDA